MWVLVGVHPLWQEKYGLFYPDILVFCFFAMEFAMCFSQALATSLVEVLFP